MDAIFGWIYSFDIPKTKRTRPMQVIAAGPSRSGTESLRTALVQLGYQKVYHGWETLVPENNLHMALHSRLTLKKYRSGDKTGNTRLTAEDFDTVFADYDAITDQDGATFTEDLIRAYPDAKVILNYRKDLDRWHESVKETFGVLGKSWLHWFMSFFCFELYWARRHVWREWLPLFYQGRYEENGKWVYREHMAKVRGMVPKERLLEWTVEDSWEPLCEFLGKEVPKTEFPKGNTPEAFAKTVAEGQGRYYRRAKRNLILSTAVVVGIGAAGYASLTGKF
jgi:hypothetical protein